MKYVHYKLNVKLTCITSTLTDSSSAT